MKLTRLSAYGAALLLFMVTGCAQTKSDQTESEEAGSAETEYDVLIGTYTNSGDSEGIYVYSFDGETGALTYKNKVGNIENPSYLTVSPDKKFVYAISEAGENSAVSAFNYDVATGALTFINKQPSGGRGPCYVEIDQTGKFVFTANYGSGSLAAVPVLEDGSLGDDIQQIDHAVENPDQRSRMHSVVMDPENKHLIASNLGTDKIGVYQFDASKESNPLTPADPEFVSLDPASGPRHFTFHPNGKYAYSVRELDAQVTAFTYDDGELTPIQTITMLPDNFEGKTGAADIHVSPDGKFVYASNRLDLNEIVIYSVDQATGELTFVGRQSSMGEHPRNFAIDPTGNFLLVANQNTNDIYVFRRDKETGLLTLTDSKLELGRPVCLKFVAVN